MLKHQQLLAWGIQHLRDLKQDVMIIIIILIIIIIIIKPCTKKKKKKTETKKCIWQSCLDFSPNKYFNVGLNFISIIYEKYTK